MSEDKHVQLIDEKARRLEEVLIKGDLSKLNDEEKVLYYNKVCESVGLNKYTRPLDFMNLSGKIVLYAKKDATDQLRKLHQVSLQITAREKIGDVYIVTALAKLPDGRTDESTGAVSIGNLRGDALANAYMKAECVPIDYDILTRDGFKSPMELTVGELVAAMNPVTHEVSWVPLQEVSIYPDQTVRTYGNSAVEFEITQGHSWAVEVNSTGVRSLKPFENINTSYYLILMGDFKGEESILTPKEAAALGWIITDGTIKQYKDKPYLAYICQSKQENFEHIEWALSEMGSVPRGKTDNRERGWMSQHWWYLSKAQTQHLFAKAGYTHHDDLPGIAAKLSHTAAKAMLEAMMRADGDERNNFGKTKPQVVETFQVLCALTGHMTGRVRIREFDNSTMPFYATRKFSYRKVAFQNLEEQDSRVTTVWCPTTELGTWICRTNQGQVMVTGNTKSKRRVTLSICGLGMLDETETETIPQQPFTPSTPAPMRDVTPSQDEEPEKLPHDLGAYQIEFGKEGTIGRRIDSYKPDELLRLAGDIYTWATKDGKTPGPKVQRFLDVAKAHLNQVVATQSPDDGEFNNYDGGPVTDAPTKKE